MDVYKIGVSIALVNGVSPVLAIIAKDFLGLQGSIKSIEDGFGGWGKALGVVAGVLATGALVKGLTAIAEAGGRVNHQLELMKAAGFTDAGREAAMKVAMATSNSTITTTLADNLQHLRELRFAFGEETTAAAHLDEIAKANAVLNNVRGGGQDQVWALVKSLENKGQTYDPAAFSSYVNTMTKVVEATGGKVTPEMFFSTFKYGRTAALGWDESFVGGALPRLIQSMSSAGGGGGSGTGGPGNALMSAFAKVVQGQMPKTAAEEFRRLDLGTAAHIKGSSESQMIGGIKGRDQFIANPYEWVQSTLMPALAAKGITGQNDVIAEIARLFPVRTASQVISEMALQGRFHEGANSPFEKDIRLQGGATGLPAYGDLIKNDYPMILQAFNAQWKNLLETLGSPMMAPGGPVIQAMAGVAQAMGSLAAVAGRNTGTITSIMGVISEIGHILYVIDSAVVSKLAAISGVGAVFSALGAVPWERVQKGLTDMSSAISAFIGQIKALYDRLTSLLGAAPHILGIDPGGSGSHPGRDGKPWHPTSFHPATGGPAHQQFAFALNVDGDRLAQTVIDKMDSRTSFPSGAPSADRSGRWAAGDDNYSDYA